jgi:hypothetical protein
VSFNAPDSTATGNTDTGCVTQSDKTYSEDTDDWEPDFVDAQLLVIDPDADWHFEMFINPQGIELGGVSLSYDGATEEMTITFYLPPDPPVPFTISFPGGPDTGVIRLGFNRTGPGTYEVGMSQGTGGFPIPGFTTIVREMEWRDPMKWLVNNLDNWVHVVIEMHPCDLALTANIPGTA